MNNHPSASDNSRPRLPEVPGKGKTERKQRIESAFLFIILTAVLFVFGWHCPVYEVTGIPCPGCGMTRAFLVLLSGNLEASLQLHPMLLPSLLMLPAALLLLHRNRQKPASYILGLWAALMLLCWTFRLFSSTLPY